METQSNQPLLTKKLVFYGLAGIGVLGMTAFFFWKQNSSKNRQNIGKIEQSLNEIIENEKQEAVGPLIRELFQKLFKKSFGDNFNQIKDIPQFQEITNKLVFSCNQVFLEAEEAQKSTTQNPEQKYTRFVCTDCTVPSLQEYKGICVLCKECYLNSNHVGHRIRQSELLSGMTESCNCGDSNYMLESGFCKNHNHQQILTYSETKSILDEKLNKEVLNDFINNFSSLFHQLFLDLESSIHLNLNQDFNIQIKQIFEHLIEALNQLCETPLFLYLLSQCFFTPIFGDSSQVKSQPLFHKCSDRQKISFQNDFERDQIQCKCSFLENLIRLSALLSTQTCTEISQLLINLQVDPDFKLQFAALFPSIASHMIVLSENKLTKAISLTSFVNDNSYDIKFYFKFFSTNLPPTNCIRKSVESLIVFATRANMARP